jgi:hypothetical protein
LENTFEQNVGPHDDEMVSVLVAVLLVSLSGCILPVGEVAQDEKCLFAIGSINTIAGTGSIHVLVGII